MSFSNRGVSNSALKRVYNVWRMAALFLNFGGLLSFLLALEMTDNTKPLMVLSVVLLWLAVVVSHKYVKVEQGKTFEPVAKYSYYISLFLALVITVLAVITIIRW